jgi:hypothetical protein
MAAEQNNLTFGIIKPDAVRAIKPARSFNASPTRASGCAG